jgi:hypothetical protein
MQQQKALSPSFEQKRGPALAEIGSRLDEIAGLEHDWDSYGSEPPSAFAVLTARTLVRDVAARVPASPEDHAIPFAILPLSGAGVQIEWRGASRAIEVDISRDGELSYLLLEGYGSARAAEERHNVPRSGLLDLISALVS